MLLIPNRALIFEDAGEDARARVDLLRFSPRALRGEIAWRAHITK